MGGTGDGQRGLGPRPGPPGLDRRARCRTPRAARPTAGCRSGGGTSRSWTWSTPAAWQYIFDRLDALLRENRISYLKWDQNRDLTEMGHAGRPSVHAQTRAVYRLLDELRRAHPGVEIESCSSGGARVDLGILERTDRVWGSDCNDALERQTIQRWTGVVVPPELVGSHIGPTTSHTTARTHDLSFRAVTAMFGHFGLEWDVRQLNAAERERARRRPSRSSRSTVPCCTAGAWCAPTSPIPRCGCTASSSQDGSEALYALVSVATSFAEVPGRVCLPGLRPEETVPGGGRLPGAGERTDLHADRAAGVAFSTGIEATGRFLAASGLPMPVLNPEHGLLLAVRRVRRQRPTRPAAADPEQRNVLAWARSQALLQARRRAGPHLLRRRRHHARPRARAGPARAGPAAADRHHAPGRADRRVDLDRGRPAEPGVPAARRIWIRWRPASPDNPSEIPSLYDVAVFENKSPSFGPALAGRRSTRTASTTWPGSASGAAGSPWAAAKSCASARTHRLPRPAAAVPDAHGGGGLGRPHGGAVRAARRRAGLPVREPRRGDRRDAAPSARADLRLPVHHARAPPS